MYSFSFSSSGAINEFRTVAIILYAKELYRAANNNYFHCLFFLFIFKCLALFQPLVHNLKIFSLPSVPSEILRQILAFESWNQIIQ